jgi:hypothetical protein
MSWLATLEVIRTCYSLQKEKIGGGKGPLNLIVPVNFYPYLVPIQPHRQSATMKTIANTKPRFK